MTDFAEHLAQLRAELERGTADGLCLLSHASYLMRTEGALWLVDPVLRADEHALADGEIVRLFAGAEAVLLTHMHVDHFDEPFLSLLCRTRALFILPDFVPEDVKTRLERLGGHILSVSEGDEVHTEHLRIKVFRSLHYDTYNGKRYGLEEYGYRVRCGGRVWLFPGDVRDYPNAPALEEGADELFGHVWLGRKNALRVTPEQVNVYCDYLACANAKRYWLTHLYDRDRSEQSMWTAEHAAMVADGLRARLPGVEIRVPEHGVWQEL